MLFSPIFFFGGHGCPLSRAPLVGRHARHPDKRPVAKRIVAGIVITGVNVDVGLLAGHAAEQGGMMQAFHRFTAPEISPSRDGLGLIIRTFSFGGDVLHWSGAAAENDHGDEQAEKDFRFHRLSP